MSWWKRRQKLPTVKVGAVEVRIQPRRAASKSTVRVRWDDDIELPVYPPMGLTAWLLTVPEAREMFLDRVRASYAEALNRFDVEDGDDD